MPDERLLTVKEVAERLRANPQTIRKWLREGKLSGSMPGERSSAIRIPESEVTRLLSGAAPEGKAAA